MFFTCQKDDTFTEEPITTEIQTKNSLQVKKVSLNDVKQHTLIKKYLDKIEKQFDYNKTNTSKKSKSTSTSAVAINSKDNTFTILTDEIIEVSTDSTKVYTFRIETPTKAESDFENFVIHKKSNDSIEYYIYRYKKNDEQNDAYSFSREQVSSDQINKADFQDYTRDLVLYDPVSDCLYEFSSVNGVLIIDILACNISGNGYGNGGDGSGSGGFIFGGTIPNVPYTFGDWKLTGEYSSGNCAYARSLLDESGNVLYSKENQRLYQVQSFPCPNSSNSSNGDSTSTWPNSGGSGEPDSNVDNLHNTTNTSGPTDFGGGSGSTSTSSSSSNTSSSVIIGVLPDKIDVEITSFFNSLTQEQKECLNNTFSGLKLKKDITTFFKNNQIIPKLSKDGAIFDEALIPLEAKAFAKEIIDALMDDDFSQFFEQTLFTQDPYNVWGRLTSEEKEIIKTNPYKAYKIFKNKNIAEQETILRFNNNGLNDKSDAFRHAFFQAINSKDVGIAFAGDLADAHESETPLRWNLEKLMDLKNNEFGLVTGSENSSANNQTISNIIYQAVLDGDLVYLFPINYADPNYRDNQTTPEPNDGTHGITSLTVIIPTNQ